VFYSPYRDTPNEKSVEFYYQIVLYQTEQSDTQIVSQIPSPPARVRLFYLQIEQSDSIYSSRNLSECQSVLSQTEQVKFRIFSRLLRLLVFYL